MTLGILGLAFLIFKGGRFLWEQYLQNAQGDFITPVPLQLSSCCLRLFILYTVYNIVVYGFHIVHKLPGGAPCA